MRIIDFVSFPYWFSPCRFFGISDFIIRPQSLHFLVIKVCLVFSRIVLVSNSSLSFIWTIERFLLWQYGHSLQVCSSIFVISVSSNFWSVDFLCPSWPPTLRLVFSLEFWISIFFFSLLIGFLLLGKLDVSELMFNLHSNSNILWFFSFNSFSNFFNNSCSCFFKAFSIRLSICSLSFLIHILLFFFRLFE